MIDVVLAAPGSVSKIAGELNLEKYDFYKRKLASKSALEPIPKTDLCRLIEPDASVLDSCLFGPRKTVAALIPLDKIIVDSPSRIVSGEISRWITSITNTPEGNARYITVPFVANQILGCNFDQQAHADAHCQKSNPNDRTIRGVILPVPGATVGGNKCGYNAYNVFCLRTTSKKQNIVAAAASYRDITDKVSAKIQSVDPINGTKYAKAVIGVAVQDCKKTFGQYTVEILGLAPDKLTRKRFDRRNSWREDKASFTFAIEVPLPDGWVPVNGGERLELHTTLCED